jgi:hypothetical protein
LQQINRAPGGRPNVDEYDQRQSAQPEHIAGGDLIKRLEDLEVSAFEEQT